MAFKFVEMKSLTDEIPVWVSMLVYIDVASAVKRSASGGISSDLRSLMREFEFFMKDCTRGSSSFIL